MHLLALNSGSSSLKFGLYRAHGDRLECVLSGEAAAIGEATATFSAEGASGHPPTREASPIADLQSAIARIGTFLAESGAPEPRAIGHRIVHGGPSLRAQCRIDDSVMAKLEAAAAFAPLHTPAALQVIRFAAAHFPGLPQVACFDTSFHAHMPAVASTLALPRELRETGLQRYGFHGLSCESIVRQLASAVPARLLIAHLGNGASITAVREGVSVDTSMGLTPAGGLIMGTRSGDLDPGVLIHLMRSQGHDAGAIENVIDRRSGLLGISGVSADMRLLHQAAASNADAQLAIAMFCRAVAKTLGAMGAVLNGADLLVFTGGIGEHDAAVRRQICADLAFLGIELDDACNQRGTGPIHRPGSRCAVQVLPSLEDEQIARHTLALCGPLAGSAAVAVSAVQSGLAQ